MATPSKHPTGHRYSTMMRGAANTKGPFPDATILGYEFRNSHLLTEAFLQRCEPMTVDGKKYEDGNRRLALLGSTVLRTMMTQVWYETDEKKSQFHLWFQLISKNSFLSKIALVNSFDVVVIGLGGDLAERNGLPLWMTTGPQQKVLSETERDKAVRTERGEFDRQMADIVKALIGAVFNDSDGQVNRVLAFIWNLGIKKPELAQDGSGIGHEVGRREQYLEGVIGELEVEREQAAVKAAEKEIAEEMAAEQRAAERAEEEKMAREREAEEKAEEKAAEQRAAEERAAEELAAEARAVQEQAAKKAELKQKAEAHLRDRTRNLHADSPQSGRKDLKRSLSQTDAVHPSPFSRTPRPPEPQRSRGPGPGPTMRF